LPKTRGQCEHWSAANRPQGRVILSLTAFGLLQEHGSQAHPLAKRFPDKLHMSLQGKGKFSASAHSMSGSTSDLNNALQLISAIASLIDKSWRGSDRSDKYLAMLRSSIERAELVASEFVKQTGGSGAKTLMHPQLAAFAGGSTASSPGGTGQSILLVDDEAMALTLVKRILVDAGYHVVCAQSGFECIDLFRSSPNKYDLVLLDLSMPMMNGEETFHRLRHIRPDVSVVICAGFIQQETLDRLLEAGLAGLVRKPLAPDDIVSHVRSTLESVKYSRADAAPATL
jgi:CheY-like chemotaxis protein